MDAESDTPDATTPGAADPGTETTAHGTAAPETADTAGLPPHMIDMTVTPETGPAADTSGYVGYWANLKAPNRPWRRTTKLASFLVLVGILVTPELIDGLWWIPVLISEVAVGTILILGAPSGPRSEGTAYFRRRVVAPSVLVLGLVAFGAFLVFDQVAFGTWTLSGPPPRVLACGATYDRAGTAITPPTGVALHKVGVTPSGLDVFGNSTCGEANSTWVFVGVHKKVIPYRVRCSGTCPDEPYSH